MDRLSTIAVRRAVRPAESLSSGTFRTGRVYADFVIDGEPLSTYAHRRGDLISSLGWGVREAQDATVARLLLEAPAPLPGDRVPLYLCPECGDIQCGGVTVCIKREDDIIVWREFAYETGLDIDAPGLDQKHRNTLGPFRFASAKYEPVIGIGYGLGGFDTDLWPL